MAVIKLNESKLSNIKLIMNLLRGQGFECVLNREGKIYAYASKDQIENTFDEKQLSDEIWDKVKITPHNVYTEISLTEDTVKKSNGKWTNRGDDGTEHGEFKTKKQADAQRKAMYANGYKGESLKESYSDGKLSIEDLEQIRDRVTDLIDALNDFEVTEIQAEPNTYKIGHPYIGTYSGFVDLSDPYKYVGEDDEDYEYESLKEGITEIRSKKVEDGDGFDTDYTMYKDDAGYFFMLGDKDFYPPERSYSDYECDTEDEANEWFDSYSSTGCYEDEYEDGYEYESLTESEEDTNEDLLI